MAKKIRHRILEKNGFVGYKKVYLYDKNCDVKAEVLATLWIPKDAHVIYAGSPFDHEGKLRASHAKVLQLVNMNTGKTVKTANSGWTKGFKYTVGRTVKPLLPFNKQVDKVCRSGIHFYLTQAQAEEHGG